MSRVVGVAVPAVAAGVLADASGAGDAAAITSYEVKPGFHHLLAF